MSTDMLTPPKAPEENERRFPWKPAAVILMILAIVASIIISALALTNAKSGQPSTTAQTSTSQPAVPVIPGPPALVPRTDAGTYLVSQGYTFINEYTPDEFSSLGSGNEAVSAIADSVAIGSDSYGNPVAVISLNSIGEIGLSDPGAWAGFLSALQAKDPAAVAQLNGNHIVVTSGSGSSISF